MRVVAQLVANNAWRVAALVLVVLLGRALLVSTKSIRPIAARAASQANAAVKDRVNETYGRLPLSFEANRGQADPEVNFLARGSGYTLFLTPTEAVLALAERAGDRRAPNTENLEKPKEFNPTSLRMRLVGANPRASVEGRDELAGKAHYFHGIDPSNWRTNVPTYARVRYQQIYQGIDLIYYGSQRQLEYDFVLSPGADPGRIVLRFQGADELRVDAQGDLVLNVGGAEIRQRRPICYQEVAGVRREVAGRYVIRNKNEVGFQVTNYDRSRALTIDPILVYSTYLGGMGADEPFDVAVDLAGNAYITGRIHNGGFPTTLGAFQTGKPGTSGEPDVFVAKLNPIGSGLVYATYLGGAGTDVGLGIAVDPAGNAYITGVTDSTNFPTTPGAFQTALGGADVFVTKLNPTGSGLVYSTYLGGANEDVGFGVAVDVAGNAYITGNTFSANFPTTAWAFQTASGGSRDAFVTKLNPTGSGLVYSTYVGGAGADQGLGIAVDVAGNAHITGDTTSTNFPTTAGVFQAAVGGTNDAFVTKLNPTGSGLVYSTYLGGAGAELGLGIAVDLAGDAYITGTTNSGNFPTTPGPFQTANDGSYDVFVTKLNPTGSALIYSNYLGGTGEDVGRGIVVDIAGNAYIAGDTLSTNFPTTAGAFQTASGGDVDGFIVKIGSAPVITKVVFASNRDGNSEIYVMETDGSAQTRLTNNPAFDGFPAWSSDGSRIAFASDRDGNSEIYIMNADGSGQTRVTNNPALDTTPAWSPDGTKIAFTSNRNGSFNLEIYVMNANGSAQTRVTNNPAVDTTPAWSPDGTKIAFTSNRNGPFNFEIYVMNADGSAQTRLTNNSAIDVDPSWSPDGTKIAFASSRDGNAEIYSMNSNGSAQTRLTSNTTSDIEPSWSQDGTKLAFASTRDGNAEIYSMNANGTAPMRLTTNLAADTSPDW